MIRIIREIKWFIQRGIRGWSEFDAWDLHCYLLKIMKEGTEYLRKYQHGYPASLTEEKWQKKLDEMIWSFQYLLDKEDIWGQDYYRVGEEQANKNKEINEKRAKEGLKVFIEHFRDLWD